MCPKGRASVMGRGRVGLRVGLRVGVVSFLLLHVMEMMN